MIHIFFYSNISPQGWEGCLLVILILYIDTISKPAMESKMRYAKGLESAINSMSEFEQTLAREIAQIIGERGFPLDDLTRVQFDRPIGCSLYL